MISEALELHEEGERVGHSWCTCVGNRGYGGFGGATMEVVDDMYVGHSQRGWPHVGRCRSTS